MVKTKHDAICYDSLNCYKREIFGANALYDAFMKAKQGSDWKPHVQRFEMNYLLELSRIQKELEDETYEYLPSTEFVVRERGKTRVIRGEQIPDRVVKHSLCDEVLNPSVEKYLIFDNGASQIGKGLDFARRRLDYHLHKYYRQFGNEGYVLLIDFSKYYDNIRHDVLMDQIKKYVHDEHAIHFLQKAIDCSQVDVSYMTDEEFNHCMDTLFNSIEYEKIPKKYRTGQKMMKKHLHIGDQMSQTAGIMYPIPIDNFIKIVKGVKFYARYMDDSYIIHHDKEYLKELLEEIITVADSIGITINRNKTHICKLSDYWRFLQIQYSLTDTGRIIKKIHPKRLTAMRRKMKKVIHFMSVKEFTDWYQSWFRNHYKIMSKQQRNNLDELFNELVERKISDETDI